jgi:hypothetical protein
MKLLARTTIILMSRLDFTAKKVKARELHLISKNLPEIMQAAAADRLTHNSRMQAAR